MDLLAAVQGCTFDDFLLAPQLSVIDRRDPQTIDLTCRLTPTLTLRRPIVSANMDTVTRAEMAIVMAEEGGIGIIDRGFRPGDIEPQVREALKVKRRQHGVIPDPLTITPEALLEEAALAMQRSRVGTLVVVDANGRLKGLLTERDLRFVDRPDQTVAEPHDAPRRARHAPRRRHVEAAAALMAEHKIKKLPIVDDDDRLVGLMTSRDIVRQQRQPFATRDAQGRLRVGAAIGARGDFVERASELLKAGVDVLVIDIAHGHSASWSARSREVRKRFAEVGGDRRQRRDGRRRAVSGGTRRERGEGRHRARRRVYDPHDHELRRPAAAGDRRVPARAAGRLPLIADGGIKRHGAFALALACGGDTVMLGSAFAGTTEAPGEVVQKSVLLPESQRAVKVPFKVLRGMASIDAIKDRLDVEDASAVDLQAIGAEGMEVSVPLRGSARPVFQEMIKHLCSSISYGGAESLADLKSRFMADPGAIPDPADRVVSPRVVRALSPCAVAASPALLFLHAVAGMFIFCLVLALPGTLFGMPSWTSAVDCDVAAQSNLLAVFFLGQLLCTAVAGNLVDRFGPDRADRRRDRRHRGWVPRAGSRPLGRRRRCRVSRCSRAAARQSTRAATRWCR